MLGLCLTETGEFRAALPELEASYQINPNDPSILYALAYANARAGDVDRAAELLRRSETDPAQAKLIEGLIEYRRGRFPEAKALFQGVLALKPDNVAALTALGRLELLDNNDAEAIRLLENALRLNAADAESTYQLGVLYDRNGRTEEGDEATSPGDHTAGELCRPALSARAHRDGAQGLQDRPGGTGARAEVLPDQEAIRMALGRVYQALGRAAEAKAEFAEVRRLKAAVIERDRQRVESDALMKQ